MGWLISVTQCLGIHSWSVYCSFSVWGPCSWAQVCNGFWIHDWERIVLTQGFYLPCIQGRPQAPSAHISTSWHFLTCISSSVPLLWLEAHPDRNERLSFSLFKLLLVCRLKLSTWFVLGDESKPWLIHISHHVHINWYFTSQGLPNGAPMWSLNNFTTNTFPPPTPPPPLPFPFLS